MTALVKGAATGSSCLPITPSATFQILLELQLHCLKQMLSFHHFALFKADRTDIHELSGIILPPTYQGADMA